MPSRCLSPLHTITLALFLAAAAGAEPPPGLLRIEVRDATGAAVEAGGVAESLSRGMRWRFRTAPDGSASLSNLTAGTHRVRISKEGFSAHESLVEISEGTPASLNVTLQVGVASFAVSVTGATPIGGLDRPLSEIAAPAQAGTERDIVSSGALDLPDFLSRRLNNVYLNELQGNPFQPDLNYRGYTASPLLGTPQGVSVYLDGVRLNQPFGDVVSWDLIPRNAIAEVALMPGSNPLFGLNTLGGALSLVTKDGVSHAGTSLDLSGGSFGRRSASWQHGGSTRRGLSWFGAGNFLFDEGWRDASPSNVRQLFGRLGWQRPKTVMGLTLAYANNALAGNGLQERRFLDRDYSSVYTKPDVTANRSPFFSLSAHHNLSSKWTLSGNAYFRYIRTRSSTGDMNEESLDQSVYQPGAAERAALARAGYRGFPLAGANAANTPFPFWRCLGNVLLRDEPAEKCNALINRTASQQRNYGAAAQAAWSGSAGGFRHQFIAGGGLDFNSVGFSQSTELGYLNPDRSVTGTGAFADGVSGGVIDGTPFDTRVSLGGRIRSESVYATDTIAAGSRLHLTVSGRLNRTTVENLDRLQPIAGSGSLTGTHSFTRLNPAIGATYALAGAVSLYAALTEGSRAPTSIELGCADPQSPCRLPNALAGDPPLEQVATRTVEAGARGTSESRFRWSAGWFRSRNRNDILFVAAEQTGFGYFKNLERTLRQGVETNANLQLGRFTLGGGYTLLSATFGSSETLNGSSNSTNSTALAGRGGLEGSIRVSDGNQMPLVPRHMAKAYADVQASSKLLLNFGVVGVSSSFARGNENNRHAADGTTFLDGGSSPGYAVTSAGVRYQIHRRAQIYVQSNNLLNTRYFTGSQLGATGLTNEGNYIARPLPAIGGEFPIRRSAFFAPGAPRGIWGGLRLTF